MCHKIWKIDANCRKFPSVMSRTQKARHRLRMKIVDRNIARVAEGLKLIGKDCKPVSRLQNELPKESEMDPKDKYTVFNRKARYYRKGAHRQPKWTRITNRVPPKGF